jgi:hypothetical protein
MSRNLSKRIVNVLIFIIVCFIFHKTVFEGGITVLELKSVESVKQIIVQKEEMAFQQLLYKNTSDFSEKEADIFKTYKENQYKRRKENVRAICNSFGSRFEMKMRKNSIIFDAPDSVSYCPIAKVASSTWSDHFINLCK